MTRTSTKSLPLAETLDRHRLYQAAVQSPEDDIVLIQQLYRENRGKPAHRLREDFCGTAATLAAWVAQGPDFSGEGFDNDPDPVSWGKAHNFSDDSLAARALLHVADARDPSHESPDVRCAFNFSYWIFRQRAALLDYFIGAREDLAENGVLILDHHGGAEVYSEEEHVTDCGEFDVVYHQFNVNPIDHHADLALHFRFADGSEMENAFRYSWRIWSLPELVDLLYEAGFADVRVHWYIEDDDGEGRYEMTRTGHNDPCWIACLCALK